MDPVDPLAPMLLAEPPPCAYTLLWWDGDNEGAYVCTLPAGHLNLHTDGQVTFDNDDIIECGCPAFCPMHPASLFEEAARGPR